MKENLTTPVTSYNLYYKQGSWLHYFDWSFPNGTGARAVRRQRRQKKKKNKKKLACIDYPLAVPIDKADNKIVLKFFRFLSSFFFAQKEREGGKPLQLHLREEEKKGNI